MNIFYKSIWSSSVLFAFVLGGWIASEYAASNRDAYCFYKYTDAHILEGVER
jgi:hypothetical protein